MRIVILVAVLLVSSCGDFFAEQERKARARAGKVWTVKQVTRTGSNGLFSSVEHRVILDSNGERWVLQPCNEDQRALLEGDVVEFEMPLKDDKHYTVCDLKVRR